MAMQVSERMILRTEEEVVGERVMRPCIHGLVGVMDLTEWSVSSVQSGASGYDCRKVPSV